jgi:hypothetical protein
MLAVDLSTELLATALERPGKEIETVFMLPTLRDKFLMLAHFQLAPSFCTTLQLMCIGMMEDRQTQKRLSLLIVNSGIWNSMVLIIGDRSFLSGSASW